jgi:hypothetical protein
VFEVSEDSGLLGLFAVLVVLMLVVYHVVKIVVILLKRKRKLMFLHHAQMELLSSETLFEVYVTYSEELVRKNGGLFINKRKFFALLKKVSEPQVISEVEDLKGIVSDPKQFPFRAKNMVEVALPRISHFPTSR